MRCARLPAGLGLQPVASATQQQPAHAATSATCKANPANSMARNLSQQGAPLAAQGVPACVDCHGAQGEGMAAGSFPRLAGQPTAYLARRIDSYRQDSRSQPVMLPKAKAMTPEQGLASAACCTGQPALLPPTTARPQAQAARRSAVGRVGTPAAQSAQGTGKAPH
ncbi:MAG: hypothetical protein JWR60_4028 [Polaromonas sp.]|nr:hypothetical protein [Polaromonas sp.]